MLLRNLQKITGNTFVDIRIKGGCIEEIDRILEKVKDEQEIYFNKAIVFPGLINSHDHIDFNLFPQLGNRLYNNYVEWGEDIHKNNKDVINKVLQIPLDLRIEWGLYKNLLNGITTVVNHGPKVNTPNDLVTLFQDSIVLHSVQLERKWQLQLNNPFAQKIPVVIHAGEGVDKGSADEIDKLIRWNLMKIELIAVHGIAMDARQAKNFKAIVWCPDSNYFLIGKTANMRELKKATTILFGTDSTVSSNWNLWSHLRVARNDGQVNDEELYDMLTTTAAKTWQLNKSGQLDKSYDADIVVARRKESIEGYDAFYALNPEDILMVVHKGNIRLFDEELLPQISSYMDIAGNFSKVLIEGHYKYIYGDLTGLMGKIKTYYPAIKFPF